MLTSVVASLVLLTVASAAYFDDAFARNYMMPLSGAAYSDDANACVTRLGGTTVKQVTMKCDYFSDQCSAVVFIIPGKNAFGLAFRGSSNVAQIISEISESTFNAKVAFASGGKVSKYFNDAFQKLWDNGIKEAITETAKAHPTYELWVTGHSLGGAVAALAADYISSSGIHPKNQILQYTFGEPRVGDQTYANGHDINIGTSFRVTHAHDIVAHVPFNWMGYYHHAEEVYYNNDMSSADYKVCSGQEDNSCSASHVDLSIDDHTHYYGKQISVYGINGCV